MGGLCVGAWKTVYAWLYWGLFEYLNVLMSLVGQLSTPFLVSVNLWSTGCKTSETRK